MTHFGIISPPVTSHLHVFSALGRELQARGHRVSCLQVVDVEDRIRSQGIEFIPIGEREYPRGSLPRSLAEMSRLKRLAALKFTVRAIARTTTMVCRDAPAAITRAGIGALLVDQMEPAGGAIAEHLRLPFVTVCSGLPINRDTITPPPFTNWRYHNSWWARARNLVGYTASDRLTKPVSDAVGAFRREWKLAPLSCADDSFSPLAQISQLPRELDFPRRNLPKAFHYVGPLRRTWPTPASFPWERLDGRPLVYASFGTVLNNNRAVFECFASACRELDVQLIINHVGGLTPEEETGFPGNPLVVSSAPQFELMSRVRLTITHAGLNTVLDSLAHGAPLLAVPIMSEQPAIARRLEWAGCGLSTSLDRLDSRNVRTLIERLIADERYQQAADRMATAIRAAGGVARAADLAEAQLQ